MIVIRSAATEEITAAESMAESSFAELRRIYVPRTAAIVDSEYSRVVAVKDDQIVGTVAYAIQSRNLHLRGLAVDAQHRRKGVARAIIGYLTGVASASACPTISLYTVVQTGNVAIFERLGFRAVSEQPAIWAESPGGEELIEVLMERRVD